MKSFIVNFFLNILVMYFNINGFFRDLLSYIIIDCIFLIYGIIKENYLIFERY